MEDCRVEFRSEDEGKRQVEVPVEFVFGEKISDIAGLLECDVGPHQDRIDEDVMEQKLALFRFVCFARDVARENVGLE